jgi:hypothetical protein
MLRINLLPSYVSQRRLTRKLIGGFSVLFVVCLLAPVLIYMHDVQQKQIIFDQMTQAEAGKAQTDASKAQAANTRSQIAPLQAKVDFVAAVRKHNQDLYNFWTTVAAYSGGSKVIYSDAVVTTTATGSILTIKAYSPSIAEIGRYLQAMYHEPDFKSIGIDKLPGYPEAVITKAYFGNKLVAVGTASGAGNTNSAPAAGGNGTNGPAYGTPAPIGIASLNVPTFTPSGASNNGAPTSKAGALSSVVTLMNNSPAAAQLRGQVNPFEDPAQAQNRLTALLHKKITFRREPQGFPVTITATLNQPLTPPAVPGAAPVTPAP